MIFLLKILVYNFTYYTCAIVVDSFILDMLVPPLVGSIEFQIVLFKF